MATVAFIEHVTGEEGAALHARSIDTFQVNLGYRCNQSCKHCHIGAHRDRREEMNRETADRVLDALREHRIGVLDITGGAPELNPLFRYIVRAAREAGARVMVRTNLTIFSEPQMSDLPEFFRDNRVEVIASLPHYTRSGVDRVRGEGTFEKSIEGLRRLNTLGYGNGDGLILNIVYNPPQALLPDAQGKVEKTYREELTKRLGIAFNRLLIIANMPVGRFREFLTRTDGLDGYVEAARRAFNPAALVGLMCRHLINIGWDGVLHDCDFNQALGLTLHEECPRHIRDFDPGVLKARPIVTDDHCFLCAAGQGSSCMGCLAQ